jgi:hypothetical protein
MVRLSGVLAVLLLAGMPALVLPDARMLPVAAAVAAVCAGGLLLPSLGLATAGAVVALVVFSIALLLVPTSDAVVAATLMGIAVVTLFDATYYQQRFGRLAIGTGVARAHLTHLAVMVLAAFLAAGVLVLVGSLLWLDLDGTLRPLLAAAGGILVVLAILRQVTVSRVE